MMARLQAGHAVFARVMWAESLRTDGAMHVPDIVGQLHLLAHAQAVDAASLTICSHRACRRHARCGPRWCNDGGRLAVALDLGEDRVEVEIVEMLAAAADLLEQIAAADSLVQRACRPSDARISRTSSAMKVIRLTTFSGVPVKRFSRSSGFWVQTPTGQVLEWHWRTMMQPMAIERQRADAVFLGAQQGGDDDVAAGLEAAVGAQHDAVAQAVEGKQLVGLGQPHFPRRARRYLIEVCGLAPVPPLWPETRMTSALALATPAAIVPMPLSETSLTQTLASGLICLRS